MVKPIELKFTDYMVKGVSDVAMWGGGKGCIIMNSFHLKETSKKTLLKNINDGGFGVENINGAICDIYRNYEGTLRYYKTVEVGKVTDHTREYQAENL